MLVRPRGPHIKTPDVFRHWRTKAHPGPRIPGRVRFGKTAVRIIPALFDLWHTLCGQARLLLRALDPVARDRFLDGLLLIGRLDISNQDGGCGADTDDVPLV